MFIDSISLSVSAGSGGSGSISFRREKFVPKGGPNGGNGGRGGHVYLVASRQYNTLSHLARSRVIQAKFGQKGASWDRNGKNGVDYLIKVPVGTVFYTTEKKDKSEILQDKETIMIATGGSGGRGNKAFKTNKNSTPRISETGQTGQRIDLKLELKILADVGLIGLPNGGKSTLLSCLTSANPKISHYPFTTLHPNIGVIQKEWQTKILADIPGLIENASTGAGLGIDFLKHVERTNVLLHIVAINTLKSMLKNISIIEHELMQYSKKLGKKLCIIAVNKIDEDPDWEKKVGVLRKEVSPIKVFPISCFTREGLTDLIEELFLQIVAAEKKNKIAEQRKLKRITRQSISLSEAIDIQIDGDGLHIINKKIEKLADMTNFFSRQGIQRFQNILKKMGLKKILKKHEIRDENIVYIHNLKFRYNEEKLLILVPNVVIDIGT